MNKKFKNIDVIVAIISSIGSIIALLWVSSISFKLDWNTLEPYIALIGMVLVGVTSLVSSIKLKKKNRTVFMIYSQKDAHKVFLIKKYLEENDINVLIDEEVINIGDDIKKAINSNIENSNKILVILSKSTSNSSWVTKEIEIAVNKNKNIYPIVIEETEIPIQIKHKKYADLKIINSESILPLVKALRN